MNGSLLNKKLCYKRLNRHVKIGKMKAKWVQITFEQKRKGKINSKNYQGLLANEVEVYVTPYRQRGKKDPYMHESVGPVTCKSGSHFQPAQLYVVRAYRNSMAAHLECCNDPLMSHAVYVAELMLKTPGGYTL